MGNIGHVLLIDKLTQLQTFLITDDQIMNNYEKFSTPHWSIICLYTYWEKLLTLFLRPPTGPI